MSDIEAQRKQPQTFYPLPNDRLCVGMPYSYIGYCQKDYRWEVYNWSQIEKFDYTIKPIESLGQQFLLETKSFPPASC